jgi:hypothetical protein
MAKPPVEATSSPAHPPPSASALRHLIDEPAATPMVWVRHPVTKVRLFRVPVKLPARWRATADAGRPPDDGADGPAAAGEAGACEPARLPPAHR